MPLMKKIVNLFAFIAGGIIAITVGFFMLRGTMRMWDRNKEKSKNLDDSSDKS
ncbi:MAG: hypothetical protein WEB28_07915 [Nitrosopumilaceae archaeon]